MITALEAARDALKEISAVASCRIGIEANISPADYPAIRIVPSSMTPGRPYTNRTAVCFVYFGMPIAEAEGLEKVYESLFALEAEILPILHGLGWRYLETLMDDDRLPTYKVAAMRYEVVAEQG